LLVLLLLLLLLLLLFEWDSCEDGYAVNGDNGLEWLCCGLVGDWGCDGAGDDDD